MTIERELADLVRLFSAFDKEKKIYTEQLTQDRLLRLDASFTKWINKQLLANGPKKAQIISSYKKLSIYLHPDKVSNGLPEVMWLEQQLSEGKADGICFKTLTSCYEKLTQPDQFKEIEFSGINSVADCRKWFSDLRDKSSTYSSRSLCTSLISLLDQSTDFLDSTGTIKPKALKNLVSFIPVLIASYGTIIVLEELFAIYAVYFLVLKGGQKLSKSDYRELRQVGETMQDYTALTATTTTTLLVRILEMIFWVSRHCLSTTLSIGTQIIGSVLDKNEQAYAESSVEEICHELILAGQKKDSGILYNTPELKVIAAPFEKYLLLNKQQILGEWRIGGIKRVKVEEFLFHVRVYDKLDWTLEDKLKAIQEKLNCLKENSEVYTCKTAQAIDYAEKVIDILQTTEEEEHESATAVAPS
jgi:hypothetical protein